jgi:hypothetical protein
MWFVAYPNFRQTAVMLSSNELIAMFGNWDGDKSLEEREK